MTTEPSKPAHSPDSDRGAKRAYVKPAFRHEQVFEAMALACGKISSTQASCSGFNQKTS
jgi:hypothetical protein